MSRRAEAKKMHRPVPGSFVYGESVALAKSRQGLRLKFPFIFMGLAVLGACGEQGALECSDKPKSCTRILEQINEPASEDQEARFAIRLINECQEPVDIKICFEDNRGGADCREHSDIPQGRVIREEKEERFTGPGIKLFARYSTEARLCAFPLTDRIRF